MAKYTEIQNLEQNIKTIYTIPRKHEWQFSGLCKRINIPVNMADKVKRKEPESFRGVLSIMMYTIG